MAAGWEGALRFGTPERIPWCCGAGRGQGADFYDEGLTFQKRVEERSREV